MSEPSYEVIFYEIVNGKCPVDEFLNSLQPKVRAKVEKWIEKLELEGPDLPRPYADIVSGKIRELRLVFGSMQYRFLYFFFGKIIVLTHGFVKKTNKVPVNEIHAAEQMMQDFLHRYERS